MNKCPQCGCEWKDERQVAKGVLRARSAARCEVCRRIVREGRRLCVRCAEIEVLRERVSAIDDAKGGAT